MAQLTPDVPEAAQARQQLMCRRRRALKRGAATLSLALCAGLALVYVLAEASPSFRDAARAWLGTPSAGDRLGGTADAVRAASTAVKPSAAVAAESARIGALAIAPRPAPNVGGSGSSRASQDSQPESDPDVETPPPGSDPDGGGVLDLDLVSGLVGSLEPEDLPLDFVSIEDVAGILGSASQDLLGADGLGGGLAETGEALGDLGGGAVSDVGGIAGGALSDVGGIAGGAVSGVGGAVGGAISGAGDAAGDLLGGLK
jgi:hypothetical protein